MSLLRSIEQRVEGLIEGAFGRAFRTHVQPVELARKLTKEMDDHRTVSVSKVYVPNEYSVYLAPDDRDQFSSYESSLVDELRQHLAEHARRERYALLSHPEVAFETDDDLAVGEFGIATRMVQPERGTGEDEDVALPAAGHTMVYRQERVSVPTEAASPVELGVEEPKARITVGGRTHEIDSQRAVIGRSRECDIQIADPNASRRHAELRRDGGSFSIVDLGSTNGLDVNGRRTQRAKLSDGDRITIGTTELVFNQEVA
jgi:FHA domain-containing protein